jgi:hypothetical protein
MKTFKQPVQNKHPLNTKQPLNTKAAGNQSLNQSKQPLKGNPLKGKKESDQKGW